MSSPTRTVTVEVRYSVHTQYTRTVQVEGPVNTATTYDAVTEDNDHDADKYETHSELEIDGWEIKA